MPRYRICEHCKCINNGLADCCINCDKEFRSIIIKNLDTKGLEGKFFDLENNCVVESSNSNIEDNEEIKDKPKEETSNDEEYVYIKVCPKCKKENIVDPSKKGIINCSGCLHILGSNVELKKIKVSEYKKEDISNKEKKENNKSDITNPCLFISLNNNENRFDLILEDGEDISFGRDVNNKIFEGYKYLKAISRCHFTIKRIDDYYYLVDNDSLNGTFIIKDDKEKKCEPFVDYKLKNGDMFCIIKNINIKEKVTIYFTFRDK